MDLATQGLDTQGGRRQRLFCRPFIFLLYLAAFALLANAFVSETSSALSTDASLLACVAPASPQALDPAAPPDLPKTPIGAKAKAFLDTLKSGEASALERFFAANISPEDAKTNPPANRARRLLEFRREIGAFTLVKASFDEPGTAALFLSGNRGQLIRLALMFSPPPALLLKGISIEDAEPEDLAGPLPPMSRPEALAAIEKAVDAAVEADEFSGVVLVAHQGKPLLFKAWGLASKEHNVPNRIDTKFNLGSINKLFTRLAATQLIEQGRLSLDDTLGKWLPDYPNLDARTKVKVRHLIAMTSGIGDFFGEKFDSAPKDRFRRNADFLPLFAAEPLAFEPGTRQQYSNGGYIVLGEVVARASGMDYYDYVRRFIFAPAGMADTDSYEADVPVPNMAEGYTRNWGREENAPGPRHTNIYTRPARGSAAGGGYSTAEDLLRFANALLAGKYAGPAYTAWMLGGPEPSVPASSGQPANEAQAPRVPGGLGFAGGAPGINADIEIMGDSGYTVVVLGHYDPPAAIKVAKKARRFLAAVK